MGSGQVPMLSQVLENTAFEGKNWQETAHSVKCQNCENGEDRTASGCPNSFILQHLEVFATALSIYFTVFGEQLEGFDCDDMPDLQGFLSEFALPVISPSGSASIVSSSEAYFAHTGGDTVSPPAHHNLVAFRVDCNHNKKVKEIIS
jgi:hypothetical protein